MANRPPAESVTSRYDDFLFAPVWDESGGMRLSVLSALARMDFDPWDEAARLARLPTPEAESALMSILDLLPGRPGTSPETPIVGARLAALLPKEGTATSTAPATIAAGPGRIMNYWLLWLCIAIAMSFLSAILPATKAAPSSPGTSARAATPR